MRFLVCLELLELVIPGVNGEFGFLYLLRQRRILLLQLLSSSDGLLDLLARLGRLDLTVLKPFLYLRELRPKPLTLFPFLQHQQGSGNASAEKCCSSLYCAVQLVLGPSFIVYLVAATVRVD